MDPKMLKWALMAFYEISFMKFLVEEEFKFLDHDEDKDEDTSENDENDKFDLFTDQEIPLVVEQWL